MKKIIGFAVALSFGMLSMVCRAKDHGLAAKDEDAAPAKWRDLTDNEVNHARCYGMDPSDNSLKIKLVFSHDIPLHSTIYPIADAFLHADGSMEIQKDNTSDGPFCAIAASVISKGDPEFNYKTGKIEAGGDKTVPIPYTIKKGVELTFVPGNASTGCHFVAHYDDPSGKEINVDMFCPSYPLSGKSLTTLGGMKEILAPFTSSQKFQYNQP